MKEISGDILLTWAQKLRYLAVNFVRNVCGVRFPGKTVFWHSTIDSEGSESPAREYLDAFMREMIPSILPTGTISVCDIGCGTAYTRSILSDAGYAGEYVGIDIVREPKLDEKLIPSFSMTFIQNDICTYRSPHRFDLVLSNTSLEHIPDDFAAVQKAHELCAENGVEVHVVPSHWALPLYLWHGYRQYTPARLKRMFSGTSHTIYRLGGLASWLLHLFFITIPDRLVRPYAFRRYTKVYASLKRFANHADRFFPVCPTLYAIVVFHGDRT